MTGDSSSKNSDTDQQAQGSDQIEVMAEATTEVDLNSEPEPAADTESQNLESGQIQSETESTEDQPSSTSSNATDSNVADKTVTDKKATEPVTETKKAVKKTKFVSNAVVIILLLIVIAALAAGAYFGWQQWQQWQVYQQQQQQRLESLEAQTASQTTKIQQLSSLQSKQAGNQFSQLEQLQQGQVAIQQRLDSHTQRLRTLSGTSREDWLLAEARYLLRLASQRLLVEGGTGGALALLQSADTILQGIDDNDLQTVRSVIAKEIIDLKLAKTVDRRGIYARLNALKDQIKDLPTVPLRPQDVPEFNETINSTEQAEAEQLTWYQTAWNSIKNAFAGLSQYVKIDHHDEVPELLYSEQQQLQIRNNLLLMLEQAQFALLHEETEIYQMSLAQALRWWNIHFVQYAEQEVISSEFKELLNENIEQEIPNIGRSAEVLTDYIDRYHKLNEPNNQSTQEQAQ